jgi:hypothetical protein
VSKVNVKRIFFPKNLNYHNTVFGGDILLWMDRVATQCARQFTRNRHVFTKHMQRVFFKQPILITDVLLPPPVSIPLTGFNHSPSCCSATGRGNECARRLRRQVHSRRYVLLLMMSEKMMLMV